MASEDPSCPAWMMTFGDCMSLLLTFFVMLISFTDFDKAKLTEFIGALRGAFSIHADLLNRPVMYSFEGSIDAPKLISVREMSPLSPMLPAMKVLEMFGDRIFFRPTDEGVAIIIEAAPLFRKGGDGLEPGSEALFASIGNLICNIENEIRITAVVPENMAVDEKSAATPWALSMKRGMNFRDALAAYNDIGASRFAVGAMAGGREEQLSAGDRLISEYVEIIIVERQQMRDLAPETVVVKDQWF